MTVSGSARKFDLYDFFSVLLPGVGFILALVPFTPEGTDFGEIGLAIPLLFGGFIVGRGIHALAVEIEAELEIYPTHRERFYSELTDPTEVHEDTVETFLNECEKAFDIEDCEAILESRAEEQPDDRSLVERLKSVLYSNLIDPIPSRAKSDGPESDIYSLVRSYIHIDARGRSRSFQAIYSFYRSMWIASVGIAGVYYMYAMLNINEPAIEFVGYTSHFGSLGLDPFFVGIGSAVFALLAHILFSTTRYEYQRYYVQYLLTDFIALRTADYPEAVVATQDISENYLS